VLGRDPAVSEHGGKPLCPAFHLEVSGRERQRCRGRTVSANPDQRQQPTFVDSLGSESPARGLLRVQAGDRHEKQIVGGHLATKRKVVRGGPIPDRPR
jgi:hypothetical protein